MREFLLYSRTGFTTGGGGNFASLREGGRLDLVHQCTIAALFLSHAIRKDAVFHAILNGPPTPPLHLKIYGAELHDVRTDEDTWFSILKKILKGGTHPGISVSKESFQGVLSGRQNVFVLEEGGEDARNADFGENPLFVLGDQVGLPKKEEGFALRNGKKLSLGKTKYLAASCVNTLNFLMDVRNVF